MDNFLVYEDIGQGKYSTVYRGRTKKSSTTKIFALKIVDISHKSTVLQEVRILQSLDHSNIIKFYDWHETSAEMCLILEYCGGGDLWTILEQCSKLPEDEVHDVARDLVEGLRYLHSKGIIHCDLKLSNILFDGKGSTKLCDFGFSRELSDLSKTPSSLLQQADKSGTPSYMAPELFHDGGIHSYASDLWALGCVLYECYAGRPPFIGQELTQLVKSILNDPTPSLPGNPSRPFADLVSRLLIKDPTDRIQWSEICTHAFWKTQQLSPVALPPQPAFDNMIQQLSYKPSPPTEDNPENINTCDSSNEISEGVNLLRVSSIAKSNLQRENKKLQKFVENDATDVKYEITDVKLDFNKYTKGDGTQKLPAFTPTVDENLSSMSDQEERRMEHEIDSSHESEVPEVKPSQVLWHESDLSVQPVIPPSKKSDKRQSDVLRCTFPFDAIPSSDFVKLPTDELDVFTKLIVTTLNGKALIGEKQNVIRYLEMLSTNQDAAKILTNCSIMPFLVKMIRQSKVSALRVQLASLIGLLISHSTFINDNLSNSGILDVLKECVENRQEKEVRRFSMAALGELLYYISTTQDDPTNPPERLSTSSGWQVPDTLISLVTSLLGKEEDDVTQLYALRTIENMSSQGVYWSTRFTTTEDVINNLCSLFRASGKDETNRLTAGSCLVRLVRFIPSTIKQVMEKLTFNETIDIAILKKNPKEQQICLNLLNVAVLGGKNFFPDMARQLLPLVKVKTLVPKLVSLVEHDSQALCGKTLLFVTLLCKNRTRWLGQFFLSGKLLSIVDRLTVVKEEVGVYLQQCLEAFLGGVVAVIPRLLKSVISDVQTGSTSKTNLQLFPVLLKLLESSSFKHRVVNTEVLQQLNVLIKLVESQFQGKDDFHMSVVRVLKTITKDTSLIVQNHKIFFHQILPSVSIICKDGKASFICLTIWFDVVVSILNESISHNTEEFKQICNDHFLPLYPQLMEDKHPIPFYADKLHEILEDFDII